MLAGIISINEHKYNEKANLFSRIIRMIPDNGYRINSEGIFVQIIDYAQVINADGTETLLKLPIESNPKPYTNAEVDFIFSSFADSILPTDSITTKYNMMIQSFLLLDTESRGYYSNDNFETYVPINI